VAGLRDYRLWWALFVFFAILSVLAMQSRYRRWRRAGGRPRVEGWRLLLMMVSLLAMTGLVFAVLLEAPMTLLFPLQVLALVSVLGVLLLSLLL
jgi:hypothetical protein